MKRYFILSLFVTSSLWARPLVLLSFYDAFGRNPVNNSDTVAQLVTKNLIGENIDLRLCPLETKFSKAFGQLEACVRNLEKTPDLVLSLGETGCDLKIEMAMKNWDKTKGPDNAGEHRKGPIILNAPEYFGLTYPLSEMYCSLSPEERKKIIVSTNAGSFVCNNTAYQMTYNYPEQSYGFIHVPAYNCKNLETKNKTIVAQLSRMILTAAGFDRTPERLPITKAELSTARNSSDTCENEFFNRARAVR